MANNDSPDQEMERLLRDHFASEAENVSTSWDPWERLEARLGEQSNPSRISSGISSVRDRIFPPGGSRRAPALAAASLAAIAIVATASVLMVNGGGGEGPGSEMAATAVESPTPMAAASEAQAPAALAVTAAPSPTTISQTESANRSPAVAKAGQPTPAVVAVEAPSPTMAVSPTPLAATASGSTAAESDQRPPVTALPAPTAAATAAPTGTPAPEVVTMVQTEIETSAAVRAYGGATAGTAGHPATPVAPPPVVGPPQDTNFKDYPRQNFVETLSDAVSTFSLDTDRTSFQLALNWARSGYQVDPASVRAEEWVNAFDYRYHPPVLDNRFGITADVFPHPLAGPSDGSRRLARVAFQAPEIVDDAPLNVTLVLDASGSMSEGNRVAIAREAAESIRESLDRGDRIAVVHFTDEVIRQYTVEHEGPSDADVKWSIGRLAPHGSTNVQAGLDLGVQLANDARRERPDAHNYVILMSDGVANVDATNPFAILESAYDPDAGNPLRIITVGVGIENYNDYLLEQIAQHGNGWYRYLSDTDQARSTFSRENWLALSTPFADQTRAQVTWDPRFVESWRIIGYENRVTSAESFTEDRKEFAEIPSGAATTVFYELELRGEGWGRSSPAPRKLADVELRWVVPSSGRSHSQWSQITARPDIFEPRSPSHTAWADDNPLLAFGAIVALAADRYSAQGYEAPIYPEDFEILRELTKSLEWQLGELQSYRDFAFLLDYIMKDMRAGLGRDGSSGYSR